MSDVAVYDEIDQTLADISKNIRPLFYIEPVNLSEQKKAFLDGEVRNPVFFYRELEYDPADTERKLTSFQVPVGEIGSIYSEKITTMARENSLIANRGDPDMVKHLSLMIYGLPSQDLVDYAHHLLGSIPAYESEKTVSSDRIVNSLMDGLATYGLNDWEVQKSSKRQTTVNNSRRQISVCDDRLFSENDINRLKVHEIGVHVLRGVNGLNQPYKIFGRGLPGYLQTEEGLASYLEEETGNTDNEVLRDYALRVMAVDSVCSGLDFRETFERLRDYNVNEDSAWNLSVRAHRGGGYVKDHVYLEGNRQVREFAKKGGDFKKLYVGKVGIGNLPLVDRLLERGILNPPVHMPSFLS